MHTLPALVPKLSRLGDMRFGSIACGLYDPGAKPKGPPVRSAACQSFA